MTAQKNDLCGLDVENVQEYRETFRIYGGSFPGKAEQKIDPTIRIISVMRIVSARNDISHSRYIYVSVQTMINNPGAEMHARLRTVGLLTGCRCFIILSSCLHIDYRTYIFAGSEYCSISGVTAYSPDTNPCEIIYFRQRNP